MKKTILFLAVVAISLISWKSIKANEDELAIRKVIENSYFKGAYNELDTKTMSEGFHKDFAIFYAEKGDTLGKYPINDWIKGIEKRKADPKFDATKKPWKGKILFVDVTGGSAIAKVEMRKNDKLVYTDYLSLLKFEKIWKIVGKVYTEKE